MQLNSLFGSNSDAKESTDENGKISDDSTALESTTPFVSRHIGPNKKETEEMLKSLGMTSLDAFISKVIPEKLRLDSKKFDQISTETEATVLARLKNIASSNEIYRSYIGLGYYNTLTPTVIKRNILENPLWYTQYTPYQAEISQGRLEALLNYQTLVMELTGLPVANASLLDEATAAAEAMAVALAHYDSSADAKITERIFHVSSGVFPQTLALINTRA